MTGHTKFSSVEEFTAIRDKLIGLWLEGIPRLRPSNAQWNVWLQLHDSRTMMLAVLKASKKYRQLDCAMTLDHLVRYTSSVANSIEWQGRNA